MAVVFVPLSAVNVGMLTHLVPTMVDHGLTPAGAARVAALSGLTVLVARGGMGWLLDRVHAPYVLAVVGLIAAAVPLLLACGGGPETGYLDGMPVCRSLGT